MTAMPEYQKTSCNGDCGNCGGCGGCAGVLALTEGEIALLGKFAQIPFWPAARRADTETPVCLEEDDMRPELLSALALKGLIRIDFDMPLTGFDYGAYAGYPHRGSMALTAAGQNVIELLDVQGADDM